MRAACLQLSVGLCQPEKNLGKALEMARQALRREAEMLIYPEMFLTGFCCETWARDFPSLSLLDPFRALAREHECLIIGSLRCGAEPRILPRCGKPGAAAQGPSLR